MDEHHITYEELMEFFTQQREIEFMYQGKLYAFLQMKGGFVLVCENRSITPVYMDYTRLANEAEIEGTLFLQLFQESRIEITTVF
ncbi:hypothetical protein [Paenibacillus sp. Z6-24]